MLTKSLIICLRKGIAALLCVLALASACCFAPNPASADVTGGWPGGWGRSSSEVTGLGSNRHDMGPTVPAELAVFAVAAAAIGSVGMIAAAFVLLGKQSRKKPRVTETPEAGEVSDKAAPPAADAGGAPDVPVGDGQAGS